MPKSTVSHQLLVESIVPDPIDTMQALRLIDTTIYLRTATINIFNGMISLSFSSDGSHYMRYDEFLARGTAFWSGIAA